MVLVAQEDPVCESQVSQCLDRAPSTHRQSTLSIQGSRPCLDGLQQVQGPLHSLLATQPGQPLVLMESRKVVPGVRWPRIPLPSELVSPKSKFLHNIPLLKILQWSPIAS